MFASRYWYQYDSVVFGVPGFWGTSTCKPKYYFLLHLYSNIDDIMKAWT